MAQLEEMPAQLEETCLPHEDLARGEKLKEMVSTHALNEVLQSAVNAAFDAGSTNPVAFMGQFLVERMDRVPTIEKVVTRQIKALSGSQASLEVDVFCRVNGVVKLFARVALPSLSSFPGPMSPPPPPPAVEGEESPEDATAPEAPAAKTAAELQVALETAFSGIANESVDVRAIKVVDERLATALGSCVTEVEHFKGASMAASLAIMDAGAALQSFLGPAAVQPFEHIAMTLCNHPVDAQYALPSLLLPLFAGGVLGPLGHVSVIPARKNGWAEAYSTAMKIHTALKEVLSGKEMDSSLNENGAYIPPAPPPPDPKAKAPAATSSAIDECLGLVREAMDTAGFSPEDAQLAVNAAGPSHCEISEETPEGAEEGTPAVTVYTYKFGDETRTEETIEMFVGLIEKGVHMLIDPLHLDDKNGYVNKSISFTVLDSCL